MQILPSIQSMLTNATREALTRQDADGSLGPVAWAPTTIHCWAVCYTAPFDNNPWFENPELLQAIIRLGDYNRDSFNPETGFTNNIPGWDEWRLIAWLEATELVADHLNQERLAQWQQCFIRFGEHIQTLCIDMDVFDGVIPNHGIWGHTTFYRIGQLYDKPEFCEIAAGAFERIFASQTIDGCFREGGTEGGLPGSAVTGYNLVSLMAINLYHGYTNDPAAAEALERGWHWWYDFLFPDLTKPPALDCRQVYAHGANDTGPAIGPRLLCLPAWFFNKPEIREFCEQSWEACKEDTGFRNQALGFFTLQLDKIEPTVTAKPREWPEYTRMQAEETCIRRRHQWHAVLCGIRNEYCSTGTLPLWRLERQNLINLYHEKLGLLIGSAHSMIQEDISTFTFYQNGAAYYLHNCAYLKSTPPLDSLLLRYGDNTGVVSVDTNKADECRILFSIEGEDGKRPNRGIGYPMSAMAARARLSLRLMKGQTITIGDEQITLSDGGFCHRVDAGTAVRLGDWSLVCDDAWWDLCWPVHTSDPYHVLFTAETVAVAEVPLWHKITNGSPRPKATFRICV